MSSKLAVLAMALGIVANAGACLCAEPDESGRTGDAGHSHSHSHSHSSSRSSTSGGDHESAPGHSHESGKSCPCPNAAQDILAAPSSTMVPALSDLGLSLDVSSVVFTLPPVSDFNYVPFFDDGDPPRPRDLPLYVLFRSLSI